MKKKLLTLLFLLAAPGSTDLLAQETTRKFPRQNQNAQQRPSREQLREHLIQRFDKNGDGRLNQEERRAARKAMRARRGRGRGEELRGGKAQGQRRGQRPNLQGQGAQRLQRGDRGQNQQDGKLNPRERVAFKEAMQKRRMQMQQQGRGSIREASPKRVHQGRENVCVPRSGRRRFPR